MTCRFRSYVSVGDSISIDLYPGLDVQERDGLPRAPEGLGTASLFYRNNDDRWPAFAGRDLVSAFPGIRHVDFTADGATTWSTLHMQILRIPPDLVGPTLVTLTAGGNDLVGLLDVNMYRPATATPAAGEDPVEEIADRLARILAELRSRISEPTILVGTVYDPSDGTADLGDGVIREGALRMLHAFNERAREIASSTGAILVPIHDHFLGHGLTEPDVDARWYWRHLIIEPSALGASEVRRLWLEATGL
jgi:lysophospholipase L1-like esterase